MSEVVVRPFESMSDDRLEHVIDTAWNAIGAWHALLASCITEVAARGIVPADGARNLPDWLAARLNVTHRTSRSLAALATVLRDRPQVAAALAEGAVSVDRARLLAQLASCADDAVVERLADCNVAQLGDLARLPRPDPVLPEHSTVSCRDHGDGRHRINGWLIGDDAEVVAAALRREAEIVFREQAAAEGPKLSYDERVGRALVNMAANRIAADADADRATIVIYKPVTGPAAFNSGTPLTDAMFQRRSCDARRQVVLDDDGRIIGLSETDRTPSVQMNRQLRRRDRRCRFPGCGATRFLHAHHAVHHEHGGATSTANLILVCPHHHKLCHEGRWNVTLDTEGRGIATWLRPDGTIHATTRPQPIAA